MKKLFLLFLAIIAYPNSLNAVNPVVTYIGNLAKKAAQQHAPSAYINWWCGGRVDSQELCDAVKTGNHNFVSAALKQTKIYQPALKSSLRGAIEHNKHEILKTLLAYDAPENIYDRSSLLQGALANKNLYAAGMLLQASDVVAIKDGAGRSLLQTIFGNGNYTPLEQEELLKQITQKDIVGDGSLDELKNYSRYDCVQKVFKQRLLQEMARADCSFWNLQRTIQRCPQSNFTKEELYSAIYNQNSDAVELILALNPKLLEEKLESGATAFALAAMDNHDGLVTFLQNQGAVDTTDKAKLPAPMATRLINYENKRREYLQDIAKLIPQYKSANAQYHNIKKQEICVVCIDSKQPYELPENVQMVLQDHPTLSRMLLPALSTVHANLKKAHRTHAEYVASNASCCICLEEYGQKSSVVLCKNGHKVCCVCSNSPTITACPLCRASLGFSKEDFYMEYCQTCNKQKPSLEFCYCVDCQAITVSCIDCSVFACCRKRQDTVTLLHRAKIHEHMQKYITEKQNENSKQASEQFTSFLEDLVALPTKSSRNPECASGSARNKSQ